MRGRGESEGTREWRAQAGFQVRSRCQEVSSLRHTACRWIKRHDPNSRKEVLSRTGSKSLHQPVRKQRDGTQTIDVRRAKSVRARHAHDTLPHKGAVPASRMHTRAPHPALRGLRVIGGVNFPRVSHDHSFGQVGLDGWKHFSASKIFPEAVFCDCATPADASGGPDDAISLRSGPLIWRAEFTSEPHGNCTRLARRGRAIAAIQLPWGVSSHLILERGSYLSRAATGIVGLHVLVSRGYGALFRRSDC